MIHRARRNDGNLRPSAAAERSFPFLLETVRSSLRLPVLLALLLLPPSSLLAQLEPPQTGGAAALAHEARMLGHVKRVLVIGAHPDDEDTDLLTVLVRGMGAEAAYLSLNRGEGGQNLIGAELGEALGILRTEELLAARKLDGARQFFTRAYDFGYSKSLEDTWAHWPRDSVLKDVIRVVRRFQPQIIVSIFSGTPRDGHGQHQAAGWVAREAFRVAGDAGRFPELASEEGFEPWTPSKLYRSTWFDTTATTLTLDGGVLDEAVGRSLHQIAMQGRSLHRSQDMGRLQAIGPARVRLRLLEDRTGGGNELFAGIDTLLRRDASEPGTPVDADLRRHAARLDAVRRGVLLDALASDDRVTPGQSFSVLALLANGGETTLPGAATIRVEAPAGWLGEGASSHGSGESAAQLTPGALDSAQHRLLVPRDASLTAPYYLALPRAGDLYQWPTGARAAWGSPFEAPAVRALYRSAPGNAPIEREASFRLNDQAVGEVRRPITVVPRVDVRIDRDTVLVPIGTGQPVRFTVALTHGARDSTSGRVTLELPDGWTAVEPQAFTFDRQDQRETFEFTVRPPASLAPGRYEVHAVASDGHGTRYDLGMHSVDYPHIRPRHYPRPAVTMLVAAPLELPRLELVGYVRGAADRIPEALRAVGVPIELIDSTILERGSLARYDAIVIGPRAYETDPALAEHNARILDYARRGGLVVVQYQQYQFISGRYAPYPMSIASPHDRVTDEDAGVRALRPGHPALTTPNRIGPDDWNGWVQERGLYFAREWDPRYQALVESHDPGEPGREGGLLVAPVGEGTWVYTGLAFFRQLPAGVPGAFRLFANLLALTGAATP
ncbi:MAG TPA: PIG-L family deacetylase [Gemmatimonadales bacterium]|nr:PIG-L family deacetylase [Gemmatimonadales bacterium]